MWQLKYLKGTRWVDVYREPRCFSKIREADAPRGFRLMKVRM